MFFRLLFLLLIALNVGVAGWLVFGQPVAHAPAPTDPGVPELRLLSDGRGAATAGDAVAHGHADTASGPQRCLSIGPFETQSDTRKAVDALSNHVSAVQYRQTQTTQTSGWWVYLPAFATRDGAIQAARTLSAQGVHDYYVITAGDRQNTVSLGLYHDPENAKRRRDQIAALGLHPQLTERTETLPQYWVDIAVPAKAPFDWKAYVDDPAVASTSARCF